MSTPAASDLSTVVVIDCRLLPLGAAADARAWSGARALVAWGRRHDVSIRIADSGEFLARAEQVDDAAQLLAVDGIVGDPALLRGPDDDPFDRTIVFVSAEPRWLARMHDRYRLWPVLVNSDLAPRPGTQGYLGLHFTTPSTVRYDLVDLGMPSFAGLVPNLEALPGWLAMHDSDPELLGAAFDEMGFRRPWLSGEPERVYPDGEVSVGLRLTEVELARLAEQAGVDLAGDEPGTRRTWEGQEGLLWEIELAEPPENHQLVLSVFSRNDWREEDRGYIGSWYALNLTIQADGEITTAEVSRLDNRDAAGNTIEANDTDIVFAYRPTPSELQQLLASSEPSSADLTEEPSYTAARDMGFAAAEARAHGKPVVTATDAPSRPVQPKSAPGRDGRTPPGR